MTNVGLALIALFAGVFLALEFVGLLHALGVALAVVAVVALVLLLFGALSNRRVRS